MRVLIFNCGSSSLKFDLVETSPGDHDKTRRLARGLVDRIGKGNTTFQFESGDEDAEPIPTDVRDHREAVQKVLERLLDGKRNETTGAVDAVGHRVVHGGSSFQAPTLINDEVIRTLESVSALAPLHNPPALQGIQAAREILGNSVPMVAVFDTAFHTSMPPRAFTYALPRDLADRHKIRRYGFHGTAHADMLERYSQMAGVPMHKATIITLQLGNGCSACAIKDGRSVDTSMGFTPLEGLVMGTRSGDIDPGIIAYLAEKEKVPASTIDEWLNEKSGLRGISGRSSDMRDLLSASENEPNAALAIEVFCYRVRKYIGAYLAALGGVQAVVFGGGIGEHAPAIRARICEGMEWCGLSLDPELNSSTTHAEGRISPEGFPVAAYVVSVDESLLIARYTTEILTTDSKAGPKT